MVYASNNTGSSGIGIPFLQLHNLSHFLLPPQSNDTTQKIKQKQKHKNTKNTKYQLEKTLEKQHYDYHFAFFVFEAEEANKDEHCSLLILRKWRVPPVEINPRKKPSLSTEKPYDPISQQLRRNCFFLPKTYPLLCRKNNSHTKFQVLCPKQRGCRAEGVAMKSSPTHKYSNIVFGVFLIYHFSSLFLFPTNSSFFRRHLRLDPPPPPPLPLTSSGPFFTLL